jgi:cytochrome b561
MQIGNSVRSWGAVQQTLHWTVAFMVLVQLLTGDIMLFSAPHQFPALGRFVHPTMGILIGVLMVARLAWRESHPVPPMPRDLTTAQQFLAQATHYAFYALLICNPLVGYLLVCAAGGHVHLFRAMLPNAMGKSPVYQHLYWWMHMVFGVSIGGLFLLHAGAALRHEYGKRDNVLRRMLGVLPMTAPREAVQERAAP